MPSPYLESFNRWGNGQVGSGTYGLDDNYLLTGAPGSTLPLTGGPSAGMPALAPAQLPTIPMSADRVLGPEGGSGGWGFLGSTDANGIRTDGWGAPAIGAASGLLNTFMGMKQYGLAKDQLAESKRQYEANYAAQRTTTNAQLEDRQRARLAANPGAYQSVGDYMNKNGIK